MLLAFLSGPNNGCVRYTQDASAVFVGCCD
jgi:hypothetical protein